MNFKHFAIKYQGNASVYKLNSFTGNVLVRRKLLSQKKKIYITPTLCTLIDSRGQNFFPKHTKLTLMQVR